MKKSTYELKNIVISQNYTKSRKVIHLSEYKDHIDVQSGVYNAVLNDILDGETEDDVLARFDAEDRTHWLHYYANKTAADLLTLGKVQPETMLEMGNLPLVDFEEVVTLATSKANKLNATTIEAERRMQLDLIPQELI